MFPVESEENGGEESFGLPHGPQRGRRIDSAGPAPFEKIGDHAVEGRGDERQRELHQVQALRRARLDQRLIQDVGRRHPGIGPDVAQVRAEQAVEFLFVVGIEIVAVPPEPVAAFSGIEFVPGCAGLVRRQRGREVHETGPRVLQEVPAAIVFLVADPDFKVLVDPGAGM